jgi:hypothetical protein
MAGTEAAYRVARHATSATVKATPGAVKGILVYSNGAAAGTATIRDGGSGGTILAVIGIATQYDSFFMNLDESMKIHCGTDIYLGLNNTDATIWFE